MQTDTASVLHEALGYIRFLHDQVQVLCSPYLQRSSPEALNSSVSAYNIRFVLANDEFEVEEYGHNQHFYEVM